MKDDEQVRKLVHSAFDKGLAHVQDRPSLRYAIMNKARGEQNVKRKGTAALVFALLALLTAASAMAVGMRFGVFDFMTTFFGQEEVLPQAQQLVVSDLAVAALDHTTLRVEEAVYDGGSLRVMYSVTPRDEGMTIEEAAAADGVKLAGCDWLKIDGQERIMPNGSAFASTLSPEGDRLLCYLEIALSSSGIACEKDLSVALPLVGMGGDAKTLDFTVPGYDAAAPLAKTQTDSVSATLLSASVSPVRCYVRLRIERLPGASAESYEAALYDWKDAYLVDNQGEKRCAPVEILTDAGEEGEWIEQTYVFSPAVVDELYFAPTVITPQDEWIIDMNHALRIK